MVLFLCKSDLIEIVITKSDIYFVNFNCVGFATSYKDTSLP